MHNRYFRCVGLEFATALAQLAAAAAAAGKARHKLPWPHYLIATRDSFTTQLLQKATQASWCQGHSMTAAS